MNKLWILVVAALLQACGGGGGGTTMAVSNNGGGTAAQCSIPDQQQHVLGFMQDEYYWYSQMPAPNTAAATMDAYFQSLLFRPTDRFSFSESTQAYQQLFDEGTFTGYGYTLTLTDAANMVLRVRIVEPNGPAMAAGMRRGDTIVSIDGFTPAQIVAGSVTSVGTEGVPRTIVVRDTAGSTKTLQMVSATFPLKPVRDVAVLNGTRNGQPVKVGYLDYTQFVSYSRNDLVAAVSSFAAQGASELVLDMRYNGGGDIDTSRDLASLIAGARLAGQVYASLRFNSKNQSQNQDYLFEAPAASMGTLPRIVIIASANTASASELVINGLKPFMDVVLVGSTTYGKPYGFVPYSYCGTTYNAVNFEVVNSAGVGGYTTGFTPTCAAADDLEHELGDPNEGELKTALGYIATGSCPQSAQSASLVSKPARVLGDMTRPPGMFKK
ncbi:MAG TPA: S41 family peptidase [Ramlibacter sp.]|nr:S41 family peptidase [Ramlibacter sp.]